MTADFNKSPDFDSLVEALIEKTKTGKISWQETADEETFIAAVKGERTFEITSRGCLAGPASKAAEELLLGGGLNMAVLRVRDRNGKILFETPPSSLTADLLFLARRQATNLDENVERTKELVRQL